MKCQLCVGYPAAAGSLHCDMCGAAITHFDIFSTVQRAFYSEVQGLDMELRRPFVELLMHCPSPFHFLRAYQIFMHDMSYVGYPEDIRDTYRLLNRPPEYEDVGIPC